MFKDKNNTIQFNVWSKSNSCIAARPHEHDQTKGEALLCRHEYGFARALFDSDNRILCHAPHLNELEAGKAEVGGAKPRGWSMIVAAGPVSASLACSHLELATQKFPQVLRLLF